MSGIEFNTPLWKDLAEELFRSEFEDPSEFYTTYTNSSDVGLELARRITRLSTDVSVRPSFDGPLKLANRPYQLAASRVDTVLETTAYEIMCSAMYADGQKGVHDGLIGLVEDYRLLQDVKGKQQG